MTNRITDNHEYNPPVIMDFNVYKEMCNSPANVRKSGVQTRGEYEDACRDSRTVYANMGHDTWCPAIVHTEHLNMYDTEGCQALTGKAEIYLVTLPWHKVCDLDELVLSTSIPEDSALIVEEFVDCDNSNDGADKCHLVPHWMGEDVRVHDFLHPDLKGISGHETAWMMGYRMTVSNTLQHKVYDSGFADGVIDLWRNDRLKTGEPISPDIASSGVYMFSSEDLEARPDIIDQLWNVSECGFGKILGAHHPVAMEFNRDFFDNQISSPGTVTVAYFREGELLCFSFIADNFDHNEWINEESKQIKGLVSDAKRDGSVPVHWYELIGKGERGAKVSTYVLSELFNISSMTGYTFEVFFESTNLSALYIPKIINDQIAVTDDLEISKPIRPIGKLSYWAILT